MTMYIYTHINTCMSKTILVVILGCLLQVILWDTVGLDVVKHQKKMPSFSFEQTSGLHVKKSLRVMGHGRIDRIAISYNNLCRTLYNIIDIIYIIYIIENVRTYIRHDSYAPLLKTRCVFIIIMII